MSPEEKLAALNVRRLPQAEPPAAPATHKKRPGNGGEAPASDAGPHLAPFQTAAAFCAQYEPISYAVEPFIRSSSVYTLTARTGAGKTALNIVVALAVATGRGDLLGREVTKGRVAYIAAENPDDLRMRILVAGFNLNIGLGNLGDQLVILDKRMKPEELGAKLKKITAGGGFSLVIVDTLAAFFDGADLNDNVQGGEFMRRLRPLTQIEGKPSVIVASHPRKNATPEDLVPYGAGAILNEVDGNLTLNKGGGGVTELHWQGKLRGVDFEPAKFRFDLLTSPDVKDIKGREVQLPVLRPMTDADAESREEVSLNKDVALLKAMLADPAGSIRTWSEATGIHASSIKRDLDRLALPRAGKLVTNKLGIWTLTKAGGAAIDGR